LRLWNISHTALALGWFFWVEFDDVEVIVNILRVNSPYMAFEVISSQETGHAPGEIDAITKLATERLYAKVPSNMIEHMVTPFDWPIGFRLRTGVPATGVPRGTTARALLVAFIADMGNGDVESLQLFGGNIASFIEIE
jgi:hypothetical protein